MDTTELQLNRLNGLVKAYKLRKIIDDSINDMRKLKARIDEHNRKFGR